MADIAPINGLKLDLPEILNIPPKLLPMITQFNDYRYFLGEGGRGSGKSQSVGRFILYLCEIRRLRVVCGREIQANIEESVYTLLKDLIQQYDLAFDVLAHEIRHKTSGSVIKFKGFREQGSVNIKGLEGVDILWIDEAQSVTKPTLDIIIPTIRRQRAKVFFTMNRYMLDDAVPEFIIGRPDALHIKINYFENPFCPLVLKVEAERMKQKSQRDYDHIWLGMPLSQADDYLFNYAKLHASIDRLPFGETFYRQRVLGIDFAAQGNDQCVATVLDRLSNQHWGLTERLPWDEPDTMISVGKIVDMIGRLKPTVTILDIGGMGKPVFDRLNELKQNIIAFDGGSTAGVDQNHYKNIRSQSFHTTKDWFDNGFLCIPKKDTIVIKELEKIRFKYLSNGVRLLLSKQEYKADNRYSPDNADSLNMAIWGACTQLGKNSNTSSGAAVTGSITRKNQSNRHKH